MNGTSISGLVVFCIGIITALWGHWYTDAHKFKAIGSFLGKSDTTYEIAKNSLLIGGTAALLGLVIVIAGLVKKDE